MRFQILCNGISYAREKVSLSAFSNKTAQEITILGGTCWHSLTAPPHVWHFWKRLRKMGVSSLTAEADQS